MALKELLVPCNYPVGNSSSYFPLALYSVDSVRGNGSSGLSTPGIFTIIFLSFLTLRDIICQTNTFWNSCFVNTFQDELTSKQRRKAQAFFHHRLEMWFHKDKTTSYWVPTVFRHNFRPQIQLITCNWTSLCSPPQRPLHKFCSLAEFWDIATKFT